MYPYRHFNAYVTKGATAQSQHIINIQTVLIIIQSLIIQKADHYLIWFLVITTGIDYIIIQGLFF